jgi:diguanylate cyclase (GGDEF)-like protein
VVGALVIEGDEPEEVRPAERSNLSTLASLAAAGLEVSRQARTDSLTGLYNRRAFDEQMRRTLDEADRFGLSVSLIVGDVDFFKRINDVHGHEAGDAVLRHVARTFQETVRAVDVCARYGGEELAVLLPHTALAGAAELAERLRRAIEGRPVPAAPSPISVTASFGVACYPETSRSREGFFASADMALYQAKRDGRNRVRWAPISHSKTTP